MTDGTRALVVQMRESLSGAVEWLESEGLDLGGVGEGFNQVIAAADQWLAAPTAAGSREEVRAACVENLDDGSYTDPTDRDVERLQAQGVGPTDTLLAALIAIESAFAQKCADTWCTSRNAETLETARAAIAAAGGKVSRNTEPER